MESQMGKSVLVVDDSSVIRAFLRGYLAGEDGVELREAVNGEEAVAAHKASRADLIFLDLTMPVMDGVTALGLLREMDPSVYVVVVTADIQPRSIERVLSMGAKSVLKKPPVKAQVLEAYHTFLASTGSAP